MRKLRKSNTPETLIENEQAWTQEFLANPRDAKKIRSRDSGREIKTALLAETFNKCAYCESKVVHNTPGDIEHKLPSSVLPELHFSWSNLTIACAECNRRKRDYFNVDEPFLDPYVDEVEHRVVHHGPLVGWVADDRSAEITVRILELDRGREELVSRKIEKIAAINELLGRYNLERNPLLRELMLRSLVNMQSIDAEYSGMVTTICRLAKVPELV